MKILVFNGGSSTLKAMLYDAGAGELPADPPAPLWNGYADWGRVRGKAQVRAASRQGKPAETEIDVSSPRQVLQPMIETLWSGSSQVIDGPSDIAVVGHRVVHGGRQLRATTLVTPQVREGIRAAIEFAPEHNPFQLEAIEAAQQAFGREIPHVAVFDTAFHATLPPEARVYPVPLDWYEKGIARYGFHGISHQYTARRAATILGRDTAGLRVITCHLGNGASLAAVRDGRSIDTTMGFTPMEGLMMGTRSGSIDPGILIYLLRHHGYDAGQLDRVLNKECGLLGVSGLSGDMREILTAIDHGNDRARLAFDVYTHRLTLEIGAMLTSLGGLDALAFTAGIGENCPPLRAAVCERLAFFGIRLDGRKNASPAVDSDIAAADSRVRVVVVHTEESWEIACECYRLAKKGFHDGRVVADPAR